MLGLRECSLLLAVALWATNPRLCGCLSQKGASFDQVQSPCKSRSKVTKTNKVSLGHTSAVCNSSKPYVEKTLGLHNSAPMTAILDLGKGQRYSPNDPFMTLQQHDKNENDAMNNIGDIAQNVERTQP